MWKANVCTETHVKYTVVSHHIPTRTWPTLKYFLSQIWSWTRPIVLLSRLHSYVDFFIMPGMKCPKQRSPEENNYCNPRSSKEGIIQHRGHHHLLAVYPVVHGNGGSPIRYPTQAKPASGSHTICITPPATCRKTHIRSNQLVINSGQLYICAALPLFQKTSPKVPVWQHQYPKPGENIDHHIYIN